jgi:hypothetical protein
MGNGASSAPVTIGHRRVKIKQLLGEGEAGRPRSIAGFDVANAEGARDQSLLLLASSSWRWSVLLGFARFLWLPIAHVGCGRDLIAGGFAFVYLCEDVATGELFVLKRMQVPVEHEDNLVVAR